MSNGDLGFPNDIAVLELETDVNIEDNVYITAIDLPESGRSPADWVDMSCVISGWGRTEGEVHAPIRTSTVQYSKYTVTAFSDLKSNDTLGA